MSAQTPGSTPHVRAGWREWLQFVGAALLLLAVSEAFWVWQTWPVRELLEVPATGTTGAR
jgi:hypothetical protein